MNKQEDYEIPFYLPKATVSGAGGAVSSNHHLATEVGLNVLAEGGNAVDAAVAVSLALSVVEPFHSGVGGGCLAVIHHQGSGRTIALDGRGTAPAAAHRDLFIDSQGNVDATEQLAGGKSVIVPGLLKTCQRMLEQFGTMAFAELAKPAINLARNGFPAGTLMALVHEGPGVRLRAERHPEFRALFMPGGKPPEFGQVLRFEDQARLLESLAEDGVDAFYQGAVADDIVESINENGGVFTKEDLADYEPNPYEPVRGAYRGHRIASIGPPSSGGSHIIQMLNILERYDLAGLGFGSADSIHVIAEAMKIAFADRSVAMGDPRFVAVDVDRITSKAFAGERAALIDAARAQSFTPADGLVPRAHAGATSHFSIMDRFGNVVSQTNTIRDWFGCGIVVKDCGFVLNNTMSDFSARVGQPTTHGMVYASEANCIQGGKVPLSSMSPTIIFEGNEPLLAVGAAGGPRIITSTLQAIIHVIDFGMTIGEALKAPHLNCLTLEQGLELEDGFSPDTVRLLEQRGHRVKKAPANCGLTFFSNGVMRRDGRYLPGHPYRADGGAGALLVDGRKVMDSVCFR